MTTTPASLMWIDRFARFVGRHWLLMFNSFTMLYAGLPWLSPLLKQIGWQRTGDAIFWLYRPLCHQLPARSFFLGSYQVCYCHRCTALYTTIVLTGLLYGLLRRWSGSWGGLPTRILGLLTLPILIDGLSHLVNDLLPSFMLRSHVDVVGSTNFWLRMITGALFGAAIVLWAYPRFNAELAHVA